MHHKPVLLNEVLDFLNPQRGEQFIDCTLGFGGHSLEVAKEITPDGKILAIEQDQEVLEKFKQSIKKDDLEKTITTVEGNFKDIKSIAEKHGFSQVDGILFDLGISSWQIEESGRGFSYQRDEPLMMNMSEDEETTAKTIVNNYSEQELSKIIQEYGGERFHRRIARKIVQKRKEKPIGTTEELKSIIRQAIPGKYKHKHFAKRTFQALRIEVNHELENLKDALPQAVSLLRKEGRLAVISFHSLEDRIVKNFFKEKAKEEELFISTKKPLVPNSEELESNHRARSAKLRLAIKQ